MSYLIAKSHNSCWERKTSHISIRPCENIYCAAKEYPEMIQPFLITRMFFGPSRSRKRCYRGSLKHKKKGSPNEDWFHEHSSGRTASCRRGKSICGDCHHWGHRNSALKPCSLMKCNKNTYCGIKERHHKYFSQLTAPKLVWRDAVDQLEGQLKSMEQFSTSSKYQFIKSVTSRMYQAENRIKQTKLSWWEMYSC